MIVKINFLKTIWVFLSLYLFVSCNIKKVDKKEDKNTYQIINYITKEIKKQSLLHPVFPPSPDKSSYTYTTRDSLNKYKYFYEQYTKKKIIAFEENMFVIPKNNSLFINNCKINKILTKKRLSINKEKRIDIDKISFSKKDSLVYFFKKENLRKRLYDIYFLIGFSRIIFNDNFTEAILIVNVSYERLDSFSILFYLEKKGGGWEIKCNKRLLIS